MKFLEIIFLILMCIVPTFFIILAILNFKKIKRNKKARNYFLLIILVSFLLNFLLFNMIKNNDQKTIPTVKEIEKENNEFKIEKRDGVTYIDGILIVNKTYPLPKDYIPSNTYKNTTDKTEYCAECIVEEAYLSFEKMKQAIANEGIKIWIQSGYRSYDYQDKLYNGYVNRNGKAKADTFSARPGHSEHQSGYAFDVCASKEGREYPCITSGFNGTEPANWLANNCYKYGFILRYPNGKDNETGYMYESWHFRYVGVELATKLYNGGDWITLESYFGITSKYEV